MDTITGVLSLHVAFLLIWTGALLYLPALFLRQESAADDEPRQRLMQMQRWLYSRLMTPAALLTTALGTWLVFERNIGGGWLHVKLALVFLMAAYHVYCGQLMVALKSKRRLHRPAYYKAMPAIPTILMLAVFWLATARPF